MSEENMNQEFRLKKKKKKKKIDRRRNYLIEEINRNEIMSQQPKVCRVLNYIDHWLVVISTIIGCVSFSSFASLDSIPVGITSSAIGLKIFVITAGIKKYISIIKKKKKKHDKIVWLAKSKLNSIEVVISKAFN